MDNFVDIFPLIVFKLGQQVFLVLMMDFIEICLYDPSVWHNRQVPPQVFRYSRLI